MKTAVAATVAMTTQTWILHFSPSHSVTLTVAKVVGMLTTRAAKVTAMKFTTAL